MSKPDPAGGSLENILASIRRSLAEQSTDALSEDAPPEGHADARSATQPGDPLAAADAGEDARAGTREDDLSDLLEGQAPAADVPDLMLPASAQPSDNDPLWFLSRRPGAEEGSEPPAATARPQPAGARPQAGTGAARPQRPETVRASRPPFFGAAEPARSDAVVVTTEPMTTGVGLMPPPRAEADMTTLFREPAPAPMPEPMPAVVPVREAPPVPAAQVPAPKAAEPVPMPAPAPAPPRVQEAAPVPPMPAPVEAPAADLRPAPPATPAPTASGRPRPTMDERVPAQVQAAAKAPPPPPAATPHTNALEAMVVELLQPMLRQWLDENMPRLVAAALKDQADRAAKPDRNGGRT